jgi:alkaline phosphatase D
MRSVTYILFCLVTLVTSTGLSAAEAVHLGMGIKIGEVTQNSAIVWARVTRDEKRNDDGKSGPGIVGRVRGPRNEQPVMSQEEVDELVGSMPGAAGRVRVIVTLPSSKVVKQFDWEEVRAENDYIRQVRITDLKPNTGYQLQVQVAPPGSDFPSDLLNSSFTTAPDKGTWKDISFAVITGQMYNDLDDPQGFHIYPAMQKVGVDFLVPTGDTVYYDSENPRARNVAMARYHWHRVYSLPRLVEFHNKVPAYWEKDDHDTLSNDSWPTLDPGFMKPLTWEEGLGVFREQVPMGEKTYRTVRYGEGLQVWMVEGRDFRSPNNAPDGPGKSIWGKEQREWLMNTILDSDATFKVLVSPTPIVGPDRPNKKDNHSNSNFTWEGDLFRNWTKEHNLKNFFVCCGDRHWQYHSVHPETGLQEFSCGPVSDKHAGGTPGHDMKIQPFHRVKGGFLTVNVFRENDQPQLEMRFHDVHGKVVYTYRYDK